MNPIIYRVISVALKPLILVLLTTFCDFKYAVYFSAYLILSQSLIHFFHSNLYRQFYEYEFSKKENSYRILREFVRYIRVLKSSLLYFTLLIVVFLISYLAVITEAGDLWWLSTLMMGSLVVDKILDEQVRYLNFSSLNKQASQILFFKSCYVGLLILTIGTAPNQWQMYISLMALLSLYIPYFWAVIFKRHQLSLIIWGWRNAKTYHPRDFLKLYRSKVFNGQMATVASANVTNLDRHVYTLLYPSILPAMVLLSQVGAILVLYADLFKIFKDRPSYIKQERVIFNTRKDRDLIVIFFLYYLCTPFAWYFLDILNMVPVEAANGAIYFSAYMLIFPFYAISRVGMEIIWWKATDNDLLAIETAFIIYFSFIIILASLLWSTWVSVVLASLVFSSTRLIYIIWKSGRTQLPRAKSPQ